MQSENITNDVATEQLADVATKASEKGGGEHVHRQKNQKIHRSTIIGAIFLMATSAIGPGFLTQTATFTAQLGAAFAFVILISVLLDIAIQLNVWRVIGVSRMRAQELATRRPLFSLRREVNSERCKI